MGSWGYRPRDCDGAWDLFSGADAVVYRYLDKVFKRKLRGRFADEVRIERVGLAQLLFEERGMPLPVALVTADIDLLLAKKDDDGRLWCVPQLRRKLKVFRAALLRGRAARRTGRVGSSFGDRIGQIVRSIPKRKRVKLTPKARKTARRANAKPAHPDWPSKRVRA